MKKTLIGLLVALMAASSFGGIVAMWTGYGILDGATGVVNEGPYIFSDGVDTTKAVWELVYTTSSEIGAITLDEATGEYSYATGDTVLSSRVSDGSASWLVDGTKALEADEYGIPGEGSDYVDLTSSYTSGNLYGAIFQYTSTGDVYYGLTALNTDVNWANDGTSPSSEVNFDLAADTVLTKLGTVTQVPEPATMSLLGLGALAMVLRRKLRK